MGPLNLAYFVARAARRHPGRPAVIHGDTVRDYAWLDRRIGALAGALTGLGLERGDRVGIVVDLHPHSLECLYAPLRAGLVVVPMNPRLHPAEHAFMLRDCGAKALLCSGERLGGLLGVRMQCPDLVHIVAAGVPGRADVHDLDALAGISAPAADAEIGEADLAWIFYTSGTTGKPKGALHTHRSLAAMAAVHNIEIMPGDGPLAHMTPMSHAAGLLSFHQMAVAGAHVFPSFKSFQPGGFYRLVERHRVAKALMVPTMIQRLLDGPWPTPHDLSSLKTVVYGGAPMYVERIKAAVERFGPIFVQVYGQGEAPLACTVLNQREHVADTETALRRLGSAGRECLGVQVRVVDGADRPVPAHGSGEIVVRGEIVMRGYWNDRPATHESLRGGWLHTGDIGHIDEDGYIYVTDRIKDLIIKGGSNIYPREVEEVLVRHPAVREAAVFGIPDDHWGENAVAAISLQEGAAATAEDLAAWCRGHIAAFKTPARFHVLPDLAKNGYGKILKREIRAQLYPGTAQPAGGRADAPRP